MLEAIFYAFLRVCVSLPNGFTETSVISSANGLFVGLAELPDGRLLAADKLGSIQIVVPGVGKSPYNADHSDNSTKLPCLWFLLMYDGSMKLIGGNS